VPKDLHGHARMHVQSCEQRAARLAGAVDRAPGHLGFDDAAIEAAAEVPRLQCCIEAAPHHPVAIQLSAQEAKAWARIGDRRLTEVALDKGRRLLEAMPYPDNLDHHFVVDPTKFDFYAMDCYRHVAEDRMAEMLATEIIQASTDFDGTERAPMRLAEARITLGVVAARQGDLEQAIHHGTHALGAPRKSLPSLLMFSRDLTKVLNDQYPNESETQAYLDQLHALSSLGLPTSDYQLLIWVRPRPALVRRCHAQETVLRHRLVALGRWGREHAWSRPGR
jgi:hypothetical protein